MVYFVPMASSLIQFIRTEFSQPFAADLAYRNAMMMIAANAIVEITIANIRAIFSPKVSTEKKKEICTNMLYSITPTLFLDG